MQARRDKKSGIGKQCKHALQIRIFRRDEATRNISRKCAADRKILASLHCDKHGAKPVFFRNKICRIRKLFHGEAVYLARRNDKIFSLFKPECPGNIVFAVRLAQEHGVKGQADVFILRAKRFSQLKGAIFTH